MEGVRTAKFMAKNHKTLLLEMKSIRAVSSHLLCWHLLSVNYILHSHHVMNLQTRPGGHLFNIRQLGYQDKIRQRHVPMFSDQRTASSNLQS